MKKKARKKTTNYSLSNPVIIAIAGILLLVIFLLIKQSFTNPLSQLKNRKSLTKTVQSNSLPLPTIATTSPKESTKSLSIPQPAGFQLQVPILIYHYVGKNPNPLDKLRDYLSIDPDRFEAQMKYLSDNGYQTISLDTLYPALKQQIVLSSKPVILTFDDGYVDFYVNAYPVLKKYNLHATVFIPTGLINQGYYLTWSQIREMYSSGLISFQAHTVHHANLPSLSDEAVAFELLESKKVLERELGAPVNFMAYPFGTSDSRIIRITQSVGYLGSVGTWPSKIQSEGTLFNMPRLKVSGTIDLVTFSSLL